MKIMLHYVAMFTLDKHHKDYNFVVIKPDGQTAVSFRLQKWAVLAIIGTIIGLTVFGSISLYFYSHATTELANHRKLKNESNEQQLALDTYTEELHTLETTLQDLLENEAYIEEVIKNNKGKLRYSKKKRLAKLKKNIQTKFNQIAKDAPDKNAEITAKITFLKDHIATLASKIETHKEALQAKKDRFAYTPSIPPVYGYVLSGFGMRRHPITGKKRFHKGIDYPSWIGAPIKATADGIVEYSGWSGSFGNVVVINHNYGYRTIYAHCSKLLVERSEAVKKGQVIGQVGTTGISTGPHLHYEVRRWRRSVNPRKFVNLDMFTASTKVW